MASMKGTGKRAASLREDVTAYVQRTLSRTPSMSLQDLQAKATNIDPTIGKLDPRSFNGTYVLAVRRAIARKEGRSRRTRALKQPSVRRGDGRSEARSARRDAILALLLPLVLEAWMAKTDGELMKVINKSGAIADKVLALWESSL